VTSPSKKERRKKRLEKEEKEEHFIVIVEGKYILHGLACNTNTHIYAEGGALMYSFAQFARTAGVGRVFFA
jgi:hypothetical protein